jgi:hypothetical protein
MRIIILSVLFWASAAAAELAEPPTPVFLRTVLVTATGATAAQAHLAAKEQAMTQTNARAWVNTAVTNTAVVYTQRTTTGYQTQVWVTVKSIH